MKGTFPMDNLISVGLWDFDMQTSDDLIGETEIDIENRYYTRHRARCGLARQYYQYVFFFKSSPSYIPSAIYNIVVKLLSTRQESI